MTHPLVLDLGINIRGYWIARDPVTGNKAMLDPAVGMVVQPGTQPTGDLMHRFYWLFAQITASEACLAHEGCAPFKA